MPTIAYCNTIDWNMSLTQRPHHIMNCLSERGWNVLWCDITKNPDKFRTKISDNLTVYHDFDKFINKFKDQIDVYFSSWSNRWVDVEKLNPKVVCYDSLDLFPQNESEEKNMVDKADIIFTTTHNIYEYHKQHTDKPLYMCENGCFTELRNKDFPIPQDIVHLPKPWLLFSGALAIHPTDGWVDYDIVKEVAKKYTVIIVGGLWNFTTEQKTQLGHMKNVVFVGCKNYLELQNYYYHCDVNLLPFRRCQIADYSHPLKSIEGCNLGSLCVATDIPVAVDFNKKYPNAILTGGSIFDYMKNIEKALSIKSDEETKKQCFELANENDWNKKVDIIESAIKKYCENRGISI